MVKVVTGDMEIIDVRMWHLSHTMAFKDTIYYMHGNRIIILPPKYNTTERFWAHQEVEKHLYGSTPLTWEAVVAYISYD